MAGNALNQRSIYAVPGLPVVTLVLTWILTSLAIIFVAIRFYLRKKLRNGWASHDWFILAALCFQIPFQAGLTIMCNWGSGSPTETLTELQLYNINKFGWVFAPFTHPASFLARISIAILLVQIFGTKIWFKRYLIIFTTFQTLLGITTFALNLSLARPYAALWDTSITNAQFLNPLAYQWTAVILQFCYTIWDFTAVLFPILILWKLKMPTSRKVGLAILLAMSLITSAVAGLKTIVSLLYTIGADNLIDVYYGTHIIDFSTCLEQALVIMMGCVPVLRSITQLRLPQMSSLGGSFTSILTRGRTKITGTDSASASPIPEHTSFENLEFAARSHRFNGVPSTKEGSFPGFAVASWKGGDANNPLAESGVYCTDTVIVSYQDRARQREEL
ncbi:hypothetical protein F4810DRAFT_683383 [Camillea tinctor]|nr:hypothetical protein F4810DRAFT_683383 [Camillea tinctor]